MTPPSLNSWQSVQDEVKSRIRNRTWKPGELIPNEAALAAEFGCARTTVNRALRALAEAGLLDRRRKAGTRVAEHPVRKATLEIPIIRHEIEANGQTHGYALIATGTKAPPAPVRATMGLAPDARALKVQALHLANGRPYVFEDRWINLTTVPAAQDQDFAKISANEWLLTTAPYTHGDITFSAAAATGTAREMLKTDEGAPLFLIDRTTWDHDNAITTVRLSFAPGHQIHTQIGG